MPRYFIHLRNQDLWLEDCEGVELPNLSAALAATQTANRNVLTGGMDGVYGLEFEITDSEGRSLLRVPVQEFLRDQHLRLPLDAQKERFSRGVGRALH